MFDVRLEKNVLTGGVSIWIFVRGKNGNHFCMEPVQLKLVPMPENYRLPDPTIQFDFAEAEEIIPALKRELAGFSSFDDKEEYYSAKRVEKAMQAHIDSLKLVVEKTLL